MTTNEELTLFALVLGPVFAVLVTLWIEGRRRRHERKIHIMRMLLATRHIPADVQYNTAINLIPAEFNSQKKVMEAWRNYHALVREQHTGKAAQEDHNKRITAAQSNLIYEIMRSVGLRLSEADIQTQVYISQGFIDRDALYLASLAAMPDIAATMRRQSQLTEALLQGMGRPVPPPLVLPPAAKED